MFLDLRDYSLLSFHSKRQGKTRSWSEKAVQEPWTVRSQTAGGRSPLPGAQEFTTNSPHQFVQDVQFILNDIFCSLNKSTLVTWINPLHPDSTPSHKSAWTVRSAGTRGGSAHPLLNSYRGKTQSRFWMKPRTSLPNKAGTCLSFPWPGTKQSRAAWPAWSSSSKNVWDHLQTTSRAIVKQSIGSKDLTPCLLLRSAGEHFSQIKKKKKVDME